MKICCCCCGHTDILECEKCHPFDKNHHDQKGRCIKRKSKSTHKHLKIENYAGHRKGRSSKKDIAKSKEERKQKW